MSSIASDPLQQQERIGQLEQVWRNQPGITGWLSATTHQAIGLRYIVTAFIFLLAGVGVVVAFAYRNRIGQWLLACAVATGLSSASNAAASTCSRRPERSRTWAENS